MSQENTETSTEDFELLPPQTVEPDGTLVDDTRKVDVSYGGILSAGATASEVATIKSSNNDYWEKQARRQSALTAASTLGLANANDLVTAAKALESYLAGE